MLVHKGGQIDHWVEDCRDVTTTKLQCHAICVQRMEAIVKMKKKRESVRGEGGCVQRMEVIVKRKKSQGGGVRVDVNGEVKKVKK